MKASTFLITTLLSLSPLIVSALPEFEGKLIPQPVKITELSSDTFTLNSNTSLIINEPSLKASADFLRDNLHAGTGISLLSKDQEKNIIKVVKAPKEFSTHGKEAYRLTITDESILIEVNTSKGVFYAGQTISQLLPVAFFEKDKSKANWTLPAISITDYPRFSWRAFMLDEARHFWGEKEVYRLLDQMALMKMNIFHWHLTDDSGWRIEIKKYPRLTSIGSKRKDSEIGTWGSGKTAGEPHGGFYTQEQIKRIVEYAGKRNITIVPEIEMPGHSSAIVASYPEYGTVKTPIEMPIKFGKLPSALDPTQEKTYTFLSDVLDEVIALFPNTNVIHIGGDEVRFEQWNNSEAVKELAKKMNFKNTNTDIQVYFTNRISHMMEGKQRRMMGWNEILGHDLHGFNVETSTQTLAPKTIIHFWKGSADLAKSAIEKGHEVVNSTHNFTYLDYSYGSISLEKAYNFDPIFPGLDEKYHDKVIGTGCQMWTEWVSDTGKLYRQIFPRLGAYAEVGWSPKEGKDFASFKKRLNTHSKRWDAAEIGYAQDVVNTITEADFFNAQKMGNWDSQMLNTEEIEWDVTSYIKDKGEYKISFFYNSGQHGLDINSVSIIVDGKEVGNDVHKGFSGGRKDKITYTIVVPEIKDGAKIILKANAKGDGGKDSRGTVYIEKS